VVWLKEIQDKEKLIAAVNENGKPAVKQILVFMLQLKPARCFNFLKD
jgi:hypothetical protein